jgi:hypothetical protein
MHECGNFHAPQTGVYLHISFSWTQLATDCSFTLITVFSDAVLGAMKITQKKNCGLIKSGELERDW